MQAGDTVQVKQGESGVPHWIYAKVVTPNTAGGALVLVAHPMNREHGELKVAAKDELRTKADVLAAADAVKGTDPVSRDQKRSLLSQADWLS